MKIKPQGRYTGKVDLWDLPLHLVYIKLKNSFEARLLNELVATGRDLIYISRFMKINYDTLRNLRRGQLKSLAFFDKLLSFLYIHNRFSITHDSIRNNVVLVNSKNGNTISNPNFPMDFNTPEGATLIASILHDGGIAKGPVAYPHYRNLDIDLRRDLIEKSTLLLGKMGLDIKNTKINFPRILGIILIQGIGLVPGAKTVSDQEIPEFIVHGNDDVKASFLRRAFDDDGCVYCGKGNGSGRTIELGSTIDVSELGSYLRAKIKKRNLTGYAPKLIKQDKQLLENLGMKVKGPVFKREYKTKKGEVKHSWRILLTFKKDFKIFREKVNFLSKLKMKKLGNIT